MPRCVAPVLAPWRPLAGLLVASLPAPLCWAQSDTAVSGQSPTVAVDAPVAIRPFPPQSLRGTLVAGTTPEATMNGQEARLAPGVRIRGTSNLLILPGQASGQSLLVNYTVDSYQLIKDVWVLRPAEAEQLWPQTRQEATVWSYNPITGTWTKP